MDTFATTEEAHSEKDESDSSTLNGQTNIDSLPDDIVSDILVRIPAQDIHISTRLVRRKWYQMIKSPDFINSHLQHTTLGLLIWDCDRQASRPTFVVLREGQIEISKLSYDFTDLIWSGCNGLILGIHGELCKDSYISNPATKQRFDLPTYFLGMSPRGAAIAYAPTSKAYKVVRVFYSVDYESSTLQHGCCILTVGVDNSWRRIVDPEYLPAICLDLFKDDPLTIEGFVFWTKKGNTSDLLLLDVEAEILALIPVPPSPAENSKYYYLSGGKYLSLLIRCTDFSWEFWETKPEAGGGKWIKLPNIDLEAQKSKFEELCKLVSCNRSLKPIGWLNYPEVLVFNHKGWVFPRSGPAWLYFAYNLRTQELDWFELDSEMNTFLPHRNSLLLLDKCLV